MALFDGWRGGRCTIQYTRKMPAYITPAKTTSWYTPEWVKQDLQGEFDLSEFDPCPLNDNPEFDGLELDFPQGQATFVNPPYDALKSTTKRIGWVEKCHQQATMGKLVIMLIPSRTDTQWFHDIILENQYQVRFFKGRLMFGGCKTAAPFPSMLVIMDGRDQATGGTFDGTMVRSVQRRSKCNLKKGALKVSPNPIGKNSLLMWLVEQKQCWRKKRGQCEMPVGEMIERSQITTETRAPLKAPLSQSGLKLKKLIRKFKKQRVMSVQRCRC